MVAACDEVFVDPAAPPDRLALMKTTPARAAARDRAWFGALRAPRPLIGFCDDDPCRIHFAGPAMRGWDVRPGHRAPDAAYVSVDRTTLVIVRADARAEHMLAHELAHEELAFRAHRARIPAWFDEGLATFVSGEPDCAEPTRPAVDDVRLLATGAAWNAAWRAGAWSRGRGRDLYCQARGAVAAWLADDGRARLTALLAAIESGASVDLARELVDARP